MANEIIDNFLHYFSNQADFEAMRNSDEYAEPWVSATLISGQRDTPSAVYRADYNKTEEEKLRETPLTFEVTSAGIIGFHPNRSSENGAKYKKNDGEWVTGIGNINVVPGDIVQFKNDGGGDRCFTGTTCGFVLKGNIMSLVYPDNFANATSFPDNETLFYFCFYNCTGLTDAGNLLLPATTLNTAGNGTYGAMFNGCSNLTTAPELPAPTLTSGCYSLMFNACTSLNYIKCLAVNNLNYCNWNTVLSFPRTGTFVKHPDAQWPAGSLPTGWTIVDADL